MLTDGCTRREFSTRLASFLAFASIPGIGTRRKPLPIGDDVSHTAESIHQEVTLDATPQRVYEALTDPERFSAMTAFSSVPKAPPAQIAHEVGGAFALFGGHIVGRHLELIPDQRIVQAWRVVDWEPGLFSIARFRLRNQGSKTTILFDHTGFPNGQGQHLASGWHANYWEPLRKYLA
jgi:activator of HSP90 ATPase